MSLALDFFGAIGLALLLIAFYLNASKKIKRATLTYNSMNFFGALILTVYAYLINAFVFLALNAFWTLTALYFMTTLKKKQGA